MRAGGFDVLESAGTYFLNVDATEFIGDGTASELCMRLPHEAGVVTIPTGAFTAVPGPTSAIVRFAFCKRDAVLESGVRQLAEWAARQRG